LIHTVIQGPKNFTKFNIQLLRSSKGQWEDGGRDGLGRYLGSFLFTVLHKMFIS